jgi:hypothetical protein
MPSPLTAELRRGLERAVGRGRVVAEVAAGSALSRLGVGVEPAPAYLSEVERVLRRGLRARARQLGDEVSAGVVTLLVREVAYEQWHRLLFARFLEVNGLLRHPEYGIAVSLAECEELALELGEPDGWSVAGRFASQILPGIFRPADVAVQVRLAPDDLVRLEEVVTGLPAEMFTAEDALGWVYQFWQSQAKAEVNASGRKIGGADLSPVTQLFTENYMVRFLLENSLGAWWAARHPSSPLVRDFEYLRFGEDGSPAAGAFEGWPGSVAEVTVMDPCCGSGHFLVAAFGMLWQMRAEEEGLSPAAAQDAVLRDNLFGLELDPRCTQIAMFAVALEAWKAGGYRQLPVPNVACSGIPAKAPLQEWTSLAQGDDRLEAALARLHALFKDADTLGSLIDPVRAAEQAGLESVDWHDIAPLLAQALSAERSDDPAARVFGDAAAGIARAAELLSQHYTLTATNPPYLARRKQESRLQHYLTAASEAAAPEMAYVLLVQWLERSRDCAMVLPQKWRLQGSFEALRTLLLRQVTIRAVADLGVSAFSTPLWDFNIDLVLFGKSRQVSSTIVFVEVAEASDYLAKSRAIQQASLSRSPQSSQISNPDARITARQVEGERLEVKASAYQGIATGDDPRYRRTFWEHPQLPHSWSLMQSSVSATQSFAGRTYSLSFAAITAADHRGGAVRGREAWGRLGVLVSQSGDLKSTLYTGQPYDQNAAAVIPGDIADLPAIWAFVSSSGYRSAVREIESTLKVTNATLVKVPFDVERWRAVAAVQFPDGLPEPFSDDPTQWLFRGWPVGSSSPLQVAVARLLGFSWPDQEPDVLDELADADGIVCLPAVGGERPAADRLWDLLARAYGDDWSSSVLDGLLSEAGGKPGDFAGWLRDVFFKEHCRVFQNRPFVWHVWDGRRDGFSALVNYHRLDRATLQKLTYSTLGWWIDRQRADVDSGVVGADLRLAAAQDLQRRLTLILEGEPPYDVYVRWKSLAEQSIGWDPDLDDGVRLDVRPFVEAQVLRAKFNVHWKKDRGTNPDGSERHNDLHHSNNDKRTARGVQ